MKGPSLFERGLYESSWRSPQTRTVVATLREDQVENAIADVKDARDQLHLEELESLHFFRILVLDQDTDLRGRVLPPRMIVSAVFEGSAEVFFGALLEVGGSRLQQLLGYCTDCPAQGADVLGWLHRHTEVPQTYHIGTLRDAIKDIRDEYRLRVAIDDYVDRRQASGDWKDGDVLSIHRDIRTFVNSHGELPQQARPATPWSVRFLELIDLLKGLAVLAAPPTILACLHVWWWAGSWWSLWWLIPTIFLVLVALLAAVIRYYETTEGDFVVQPQPGQVEELVADEDYGIQNQFSMLTPVRDSWFRRWNLRFVLWLANNASKHFYRRGRLVGIDTIHFARFHLLDGGRRMLFMSDFDGGWERYLFDFVGVGSFAVVPIWTHLHGCPKTRFLLFPSKGFAQRFLPFTRANQRQTHLWYSAIDHLTVGDIKRNAKIRAGLFGPSKRRAVEKWLKLI